MREIRKSYSDEERYVPGLHEDLVLEDEGHGGKGDAVLVLGQELHNRRGAVPPLIPAAGEDGTGEHGVASKEPQDAIDHDGRLRCIGG